MPTNWPPVPNPWPPPEIGECSFSDLATFQAEMAAAGFTWRNATPQEVNAQFKAVRCDEGHNVNVIMIYKIGTTGPLYPFAYCTAASHRALLALWPPYELGWGSS